MIGPIDWVRRKRAQWQSTPRHRRHDDVFLIEFPKSGVTWLSTLCANLALIESGRPERATFGSVPFYVPDIHKQRVFGDLLYDRPASRFIKTHAVYNPAYRSGIYLVRNPVDVMKSYYNYSRSYQYGFAGDFAAFVDSPRYGIAKWRDHVRSWLVRVPNDERIMVVRYEDIKRDAAGQLAQIAEAFGWSVAPESVTEAVACSAMGRMSANEELFARWQSSVQGRFVGQPFKGDIPDGIARRITEQCAEELAMLGYVVGADGAVSAG